MKKILFALALLLTIGAVDALAQSNPPLSNKRIRMKGQAAAPTPDPPTGYYNLWVDSGSGNLYITNAAGTDTPVGAGISGLTDNVIPQANGTTAIENSKMTTSGANSGTWTLYDDTAVTGTSRFAIRSGAADAGVPSNQFAVYANDGTTAILAFQTSGYGFQVGPAGSFTVYGNSGNIASQAGFGLYAHGYASWSIINPHIKWPDGSSTVGLNYSAAGILAVTDGSTGQGGIGIADSATNTVTDALILRHATSGTAAASFGTGLLFQGEDAAGNMQDMASIDAVYTDATNGSEDGSLVFSGITAGAVGTIATLKANDLVFTGNANIEADNLLLSANAGDTYVQATGAIRFGTIGVAGRWIIDGTSGYFAPQATNTYDIGTSSALVKSAYVSTSIQGVRAEVIPSDNVAENFVVITSAVENAVTAGYIEYTVTAVDTTNEIIQTETGVVPFVAVNENGTVTASLGTPYGVHQDNAGGGALVVSFGSSVATTNVTFTVTSNYDEATLTGTVVNTMRYRVVLTSGTATVTPET